MRPRLRNFQHACNARPGAHKSGMTTTPHTERGRKLLDQSSLFRALDEAARQALGARARPRSYAAGERIFTVGAPGQSMMAVLVGTVRISLPTHKGREIVLADMPAGEVFGEIALLDGKERSADATALTNCELLVLERQDVLPFLQNNPAACLRLMELLCARIRRSDERMADIAFFDIPARLAKTLLRLAGEASGRKPTRLAVSQSDLAKMIGGTRENVNRCLRDWQKRGILDIKEGWTTLLKPDALSDLA